MRYLLAILLPPLAVLLCGKPFLAILNLLLTLCFWIPGVVHALFVVNSHLADLRVQGTGPSDGEIPEINGASARRDGERPLSPRQRSGIA